MPRKVRSRLSYANVAATIALFAAIGGGAAAIGGVTDDEGQIQACYDKKGGNRGDVRLLVKGKCTKQEKRVSWSEQGPVGPAGAPGEQGSPGPATGPASGDLSGTYPDPVIADGAVTESKLGCGSDANQVMVKVGSTCIDRYEASVWSAPTGGIQYGASSDDYPCNDNGQNCTGANAIYARSVPGVKPSTRITWFQAQQALANSAKQLPSNAEWQAAVAGTPDPPGSSACSPGSLQNTGANAGCISNFGANDMVGNVYEWVADWVPLSTSCPPAIYAGDDDNCFGGASTANGPGALLRGGDEGSGSGPFTVFGTFEPSQSFSDTGFRGAR